MALTALFCLLAQPLAASAGCWPMVAAEKGCPGECPMGHETGPSQSNRAQAADPGCCEITSSEPIPHGIAATAAPTSPPVYLASAAGVALRERPVMPVLPTVSPPRHAPSPLTELYCTFLI